jgi:SOS-response transcriptional repressor LexA
MTKRWKLVFNFIVAYQRIHGVPPTYQIMAIALGMRSRSNMHRIVGRLKELGYLDVEPKRLMGVKFDKSVYEVTKL